MAGTSASIAVDEGSISTLGKTEDSKKIGIYSFAVGRSTTKRPVYVEKMPKTCFFSFSNHTQQTSNANSEFSFYTFESEHVNTSSAFTRSFRS